MNTTGISDAQKRCEMLCFGKEFRTFGMKCMCKLCLCLKLKMNLYNSPQVQERVLSDAVLNMPVRSGEKEAFRFYQTNVMPQVLADKYPEIKSFMGIGLNDPSTRASIVINNNTIHGMVISDIGNSFFTAADHQNNEPVTVSDGSEQNELMTCDIEKKFIESSKAFFEIPRHLSTFLEMS